MKRTCILMVTLLAVVALAAGNAFAQAKILKVSNGVNEQHPSYLGGKKFGEILNAKLPGKYDVQVYANAQLGDDVRATEGVRMGTLEMVCTSASPLTGLVPEFNVFDLPFIVTTEKAADAIYDGPVGAKLGAALEPKGIKLLAYYENGFRQLTNSVRAVQAPADLKGLKIRTMQNPIHLEAFRAMGANPTPMPFSEVFTALQQKTIDGQENPIPTIYSRKFYEVQGHLSMTRHMLQNNTLVLTTRAFDKLTKEQQAILMEEAAAASAKNSKAQQDNEKSMLEDIRKSNKTAVNDNPDRAAFAAKMSPAYQKLEARWGAANLKRVRDAIDAGRAKK